MEKKNSNIIFCYLNTKNFMIKILHLFPVVPFEMTIHTGDVKDAGTDAKVFVKFFGEKGTTSDIHVDKCSERFERARADLIKLEIEDVGKLVKMRVGHDGKGSRNQWFIEKVRINYLGFFWFVFLFILESYQ